MSKLSQWLLGLKGFGGSTFPGYIIEKIAPGSVKHVLGLLPDTVVMITGTNGKTTTTKMIADMLRAEGRIVFTNKSGSNFVRGVLAQVVRESNLKFGRLQHDIAVLELDEAYGPQFVQYVQPDYVVGLNILRDQLDRFGEIDQTAKLIGTLLRHATRACIVNGNEPELVKISRTLPVKTAYYAVVDELRKVFPTDAELITIDRDVAASERLPRDVELMSITNDRKAAYLIQGKKYNVELSIPGIYNFQNAAAALATVRSIAPQVSIERWLEHLQAIQPAFGRGESLTVGDKRLEIVLVKNPAGFQQALHSYKDQATVMIAINDNYADGRDISWLWDVDCSTLVSKAVAIVSGLRAYDMALRLHYDNVKPDRIEEDLAKALQYLLADKSNLLRIFCNYTAMLTLRAEIAKKAPLERLL